ncbi:pirin family protein [Streptacidiphilus monticola]
MTWVLEGALSHRDDHGHAAVVRPGTLQYLSAGSGVEHSERAAEGPVRFLQFWLQPDAFGTRPRYALRTVDPAAAAVDLTQGQLRRGDASLHLRRAEPYALVDLPTATYLYLHVVRGALGFRTASGPRGVGVELAPGTRLAPTPPARWTRRRARTASSCWCGRWRPSAVRVVALPGARGTPTPSLRRGCSHGDRCPQRDQPTTRELRPRVRGETPWVAGWVAPTRRSRTCRQPCALDGWWLPQLFQHAVREGVQRSAAQGPKSRSVRTTHAAPAAGSTHRKVPLWPKWPNVPGLLEVPVQWGDL